MVSRCPQRPPWVDRLSLRSCALLSPHSHPRPAGAQRRAALATVSRRASWGRRGGRALALGGEMRQGEEFLCGHGHGELVAVVGGGETGAGHLQTQAQPIRGGADPRPRASAQKLDSWQPWPLTLDRPQGCSEVIKGETWGQVSSLNGTSMSTATHLVRAGGRVPGPGVLAGWGHLYRSPHQLLALASPLPWGHCRGEGLSLSWWDWPSLPLGGWDLRNPGKASAAVLRKG